MAIAFNIPSEREAPEENFSRLNRLLAELYDVLCHILVARQPSADQDQRRERPFSDSDLERPTFSGLPEISNQIATRPRPLSASTLMPLLNLDFNDLDDDVFVSPRTDQGNDPFSDPRNMEIFGNPRNGSPRTPAGVLLSPRRERRFTFTGNEKHWRDKGGTDEADGLRIGRSRNNTTSDETDTSSEPSTSRNSSSSEGSILSSILPDKISGSICTAVLFVLGWKLLTTKR